MTSTNPAPAGSQRDVRVGVAVTLLVAAVGALTTAAALAAWPQVLSGETTQSWSEAMRTPAAWPIVAWLALLGAKALAGALALYTRRDDPAANEPLALAPALGVGLLIFALYFTAPPIYLWSRLGLAEAIGPTFLWSVLLAIIGLVAGLLLSVQAPTLDGARFRLIVGGAGGLIGMVSALYGFAVPVFVYSKELTAGLESWRENWHALLLTALPLLGGLVLMFASLQLGRRLERQSQSVRRIIYGYNAVLTGLLLLAVLALPNVLAYAYPFTKVLDKPYDWTSDSFFTLSPQLRRVLANLRVPVKVYLLMPRDTRVAVESQRMLDTARSLTGKVSWELIDLSDPGTRDRFTELRQKYAIPGDGGMLLVPEQPTGGKGHEFVTFDNLAEMKRDPNPNSQRRPAWAFKGEGALLSALVALTENKMVVYFTQGHDEMSIAPTPPMMRERDDAGPALGRLRAILTDRRSIEVKTLGDEKKRELGKIPSDASVVVIAQPKRAYTPEEVRHLRDYLSRKEEKTAEGAIKVTAGRLMVLVDPLIRTTGDQAKIRPTGLEELLRDYNVVLGENRVLRLQFVNQQPIPNYLECFTNPRSDNPIARAFRQERSEQTFVFIGARTVEPVAQAGGARTVDRLVLADIEQGVWVDTDLAKSDLANWQVLYRSQQKRRELLREDPPCIAVAVSDRAPRPGVPADADHAGLGQKVPRMVVFGSSLWITDPALQGRQGEGRVDLFTSCLAWLNESAAVGATAPPRVRAEYTLGVKTTDMGRLRYLPLGLMVVGVVGMGLGVWVVRRR